MIETGHYIGAPNGIVLCVNKKARGLIEGELYHGYSKEGHPFTGCEEIIKTAEEFFNTLGFPHRGTCDRDIEGRTYSHQKKRGMTRALSDENMLEKHGDIGTFVIRVQHRQHSSWQGRVTYLEEDKSVYFRSVLELIKIIDGVLDKAEQTDKAEEDGASAEVMRE